MAAIALEGREELDALQQSLIVMNSPLAQISNYAISIKDTYGRLVGCSAVAVMFSQLYLLHTEQI